MIASNFSFIFNKRKHTNMYQNLYIVKISRPNEAHYYFVIQ